ncbi:MAG: Wzz/FepE/Etk N-terminal domain-containing protein [Clostridia bacterium]|nr:Wzz/FepE/Etk N-terminal domain-containing protein [Clostridia bacterium]
MDIRNDETEIDLLELAKALWQKAWIIAIASVACALLTLLYSAFMITPKYQAKTLLYVNNAAQSTSGNITSSDINASKSLVSTYGVILTSETTMDAVAEKTGLPYSTGELKKMVATASVNTTEVLQVTVTCSSPEHAERIANAIVEILPGRITEILEGSSVRVVEYAKVPKNRVSPNISKNTMLGFLAGFVLSCAVICVIYLLDDTIHNEEYLSKYSDIPVLAAIPDFHQKKAKKYGYYKYGDYDSYGK